MPKTDNSPVIYAAIMTLWLLALVGFLKFLCVPGFVNVISLVITAAPSLLILNSLEDILIAQWAQWIAKCQITVPVCVLEDPDTRTSGIRGFSTDLLKCQDFWSVYCILEELYSVSEAPLDVLNVDLWVNLGDINFSIEQWFLLCYRMMVHIPF